MRAMIAGFGDWLVRLGERIGGVRPARSASPTYEPHGDSLAEDICAEARVMVLEEAIRKHAEASDWTPICGADTELWRELPWRHGEHGGRNGRERTRKNAREGGCFTEANEVNEGERAHCPEWMKEETARLLGLRKETDLRKMPAEDRDREIRRRIKAVRDAGIYGW